MFSATLDCFMDSPRLSSEEASIAKTELENERWTHSFPDTEVLGKPSPDEIESKGKAKPEDPCERYTHILQGGTLPGKETFGHIQFSRCRGEGACTRVSEIRQDEEEDAQGG